MTSPESPTITLRWSGTLAWPLDDAVYCACCRSKLDHGEPCRPCQYCKATFVVSTV